MKLKIKFNQETFAEGGTKKSFELDFDNDNSVTSSSETKLKKFLKFVPHIVHIICNIMNRLFYSLKNSFFLRRITLDASR